VPARTAFDTTQGGRAVTSDHVHALPAGYRLHEYRIERLLGHGTFGMTYLAHDGNLDAAVAIKEYLPGDFAVRDAASTVVPKSTVVLDSYEWGLEQFLKEAQVLARFHHPNVVRVLRLFRANGTAYIVMPYEVGVSLTEHLKTLGRPMTEAELLALALPLLDVLEAVHAHGVLHRDLKPGNILMRETGGPLLLDFGAARQATAAAGTVAMTAVLTPGFAPFEQYTGRGRQGPWTDIYALGAVLYRCLGGPALPEAAERIAARHAGEPDPLRPAADIGFGRYRDGLLAAIDDALRLDAGDRPQSVTDWRRALAARDSEAAVGLDETVVATIPGTAGAGQGGTVPVSPGPDLPRRRGRRRRRLAIAAAVALLVAAGAVASEPLWPEEVRARVRAVLPAADAPARIDTAQEDPAGPVPAEDADAGLAEFAAGPAASDRAAATLAAAGTEATDPPAAADPEADQPTADPGDAPDAQPEAGPDETADAVAVVPPAGLERRAWEDATLRDSPAAYRHYLAAYPDGAHADAARTWIRDRQAAALRAHEAMPATLAAYEAALPAADRLRIQQALRAAGHYRGGIDGRFGPMTRRAIRAWQRTAGAAETGMLTPAQIGALLGDGRFRDCIDCPEMAVVPGGTFTMGATPGEEERAGIRPEFRGRAGPQREVAVDAIALGRFEVTRAEFDAFAEATGREPAGGCRILENDLWVLDETRSWRDPAFDQGDREPAVCVSWQDARAYAAWLSLKTGQDYRLPTEAEWEYAARAGTSTARPWGDAAAEQCRHANGADRTAGEAFGWPADDVAACTDGIAYTAAGGSFAANGFGLHDMLGNAWEWTQDCWTPDLSAAAGPGEACPRRVVRGGSWDHGPALLRPAQRSWYLSDDRLSSGGFRVARTLP